jgi:hypothetical protein
MMLEVNGALTHIIVPMTDLLAPAALLRTLYHLRMILGRLS